MKKHTGLIIIAGAVVGWYAATSAQISSISSLSAAFAWPDALTNNAVSGAVGVGIEGAGVGALYGWLIAKYLVK